MKRRKPIVRREWEGKGGATVPQSWLARFLGVLPLVAGLEFRAFFASRVPLALGVLPRGGIRRCAFTGGLIRPQPVGE